MLKLLVIADDFTGALDTGVQFSKQGAKTLVSTEVNIDYQKISDSVEVLVIDTESRHLEFEVAYNIIKDIVLNAKKENIPYIYKKVDSALRGNISAEIKALVDYGNQEVVPFLPSYPEMNRVLVDGHLYIDQVLVSESVFAEDPYEPVTESNVMKRLKEEAHIEATLVNEEGLPIEKNEVYVFDARSNATLDKHMKWLNDSESLNISVGCAGFANVLGQHLFPDGRNKNEVLDNPIVVICGSINPITQKQVEYVEQLGYPRISLSGKQLLDINHWDSNKGQEEINAYLELINTNKLIAFETFSDQTSKEIVNYRKQYQLEERESRFRIGASLGKLTELLWMNHHQNTFLFTGGDTLYQSMKMLNISEIEPMTEISSGVVLSTMEWNKQQRKVITKSGGFGKETLFTEFIV
ncbi:four-carbon acid sugar kinase family protein [Mammaliicoccus sp. Dog046]|uniref:four-carbon acid sugar kinase family protein n=1 Tax=Mammaliicoccus sp. Dog046 TaxID=3034233 RepID=UPI002B25AE09|nr:four-carbon acid sugar kinase family protein [Mammaliicoccus sp. Dog046]WQK85761.1 four-carbon acid sugar kinase family protein [Mammaliicoccus sp. Dog046]